MILLFYTFTSFLIRAINLSKQRSRKANFHFCSEILECDSSPCLNEGKCVEGSFGSGVGSGLDMTESVYTCECAPGFTGMNCETSKNCLLSLV